MTECSRAAPYPPAQVYQASMTAATAAPEKPICDNPIPRSRGTEERETSWFHDNGQLIERGRLRRLAEPVGECF
jgi:hypothetical protein